MQRKEFRSQFDPPSRRKKNRRRKKCKGSRCSLHILHGKQHGRCFFCHTEMIVVCLVGRGTLPADAITRDHLIPRSRGGTNDARNIVGACHACNQERGAQSWQTFLASKTPYLTAWLH